MLNLKWCDGLNATEVRGLNYKVRLIRRISVSLNAIETIDNEQIASLPTVCIALHATETRRLKQAESGPALER